MKLKELYQTEYARIQGFVPLPETRPHTIITVSQHNRHSDGWKEATVNYPSIGAQDADTIKKFAETLLAAAELAKEWTANPPAPAESETTK